MSNIVSYFNVGDRAVLNYQKGGSTCQAIVQVVAVKELNETVRLVVKAPLKILNQIHGVVYLLDHKKYEIEDDWGVTMVTPDALSPLQKPLLKLV